MRRTVLTALALLGLVGSAAAQVPAVQIAGVGAPPPPNGANQTKPSSPCGGAIVAGFFFDAGCADSIEGWRNYTTDTGDIETATQLTYNSSTDDSLGGNGLCVEFCKLGQVFADGTGTVFAASNDAKGGGGQPGNITIEGVWRFTVTVFQGQPFWEAILLAPDAGLGGNGPNGVWINSVDRRLYGTFKKNGNVYTMDNPYAFPRDPANPQTIRTIGNTFNGRSSQGGPVQFGRNLYIATRDGLNVFLNADACGSPAGSCNGQLVSLSVALPGIAAPHPITTVVGLMVMGNYVYMAVNDIGAIVRWNPVTGGTQLVSNGFSFINGEPNTLFATPAGSIIVGDDLSDGLRLQTGRLWRINASGIATLPPV